MLRNIITGSIINVRYAVESFLTPSLNGKGRPRSKGVRQRTDSCGAKIGLFSNHIFRKKLSLQKNKINSMKGSETRVKSKSYGEDL